MAVKRTTPQSEIDREIEKAVKQLEKAVIYNLRYVGEKAVKHARSLPSPKALDTKNIPPHQPNYIDWTGNLRSSIGYVIAKDGKIVDSGGFQLEKGGEDGTRTGREYAEQLATQVQSGYALIVVAGMGYASYVTNKGYDVIDSAELLAEQLASELMKDLKLK